MRDLLLKLFNLDRADFSAAEGWKLRLMSEWAPAVVVFACLALVVLVWQIYKREKGTASARFKLMLALLRLLALAVLVFVLLAPAVVIVRSELKESYVVILADKSDSMNLEDKYRDDETLARLAYAVGLREKLAPSEPVELEVAEEIRAMSRAEIANRALANPKLDLVGRIAQNAKVRQFVFASTISPAPVAGPESRPEGSGPESKPTQQTVRPLVIKPDGPVTQIGESIRDAVAELRGQRIAAMVVLSDWCSNSGLPPTEATRYALDAKSAFPIFTVGVGDPAGQRDIVVSSVSANTVAFLNDPLMFNVAIEQSGYDGAVVPLELRLGEKIVATRNITLVPGYKYYTISHKPSKKGVCKYRVSVPARDDELSARNNVTEHTVTVKDDKIRVLLIAAAPSWEWRFLKAALVRDKSVRLCAWLQSADRHWTMAGGKQLDHLPLNKKELVDNYDVVFMLGASPDTFSEEQLDNIRSFVGDFGGGLIFSAGAGALCEGFANTALAKCLPVSLESPTDFRFTRAPMYSFELHVTPEGWAHPAMKLAQDAHQNRELWEHLPKLFWFHPIEKVKPGARVLATHSEEKSERGLFPIFVEQRYGAGKVFFSATDETWRWRFIIGDKYFYQFWRQTIGLIAANKLLGSAKRLTISVARNKYSIGQKVEIEARVLDQMLRPSGEKSLMATLALPGGSTRKLDLALVAPNQGLYRGSFIPRKIGSYAARVRPSPTEEAETVPFSVTMSTLESESRRLDLETMKAVAKKTSAAWFTIDQIGRIPEKIKSESTNITTEHPTEIWDSWGCLLLFTIPLACEWWLRKRRLLT